MERSTRWLGLLFVGSVLVRPMSATAQTVKPADLVGTWEALPGNQVLQIAQADTSLNIAKHTLTFRSDSTWERANITKDGKTSSSKVGRWYRLSGDTIWWIRSFDGPGVKIVLQNEQLSFYGWWDLVKPREAYKRVNSPKQP